jgi:hypothetical protein
MAGIIRVIFCNELWSFRIKMNPAKHAHKEFFLMKRLNDVEGVDMNAEQFTNFKYLWSEFWQADWWQRKLNIIAGR